MAYTAFKAGDKVSWDGNKALVVEDADSEHGEVKVYIGGRVENWDKVTEHYGETIPVILES